MVNEKAPKRNPLAGLGRESEPPARYTDTLGSGRKRRKDATGRKKDYHKGTATLAVRLPTALTYQVRARAEAEGVSVNAWLAALITDALER